MKAKTAKRLRSARYHILWHLVLILFALLFMLPLVFMVTTALKGAEERILYTSFFDMFWVRYPQWDNFVEIFRVIPFFRYAFNSLVVAGLSTIGIVFSSAFVAYSLSKIDWPGKNLIFSIILITMMIPLQVMQIQSFILFDRLGWVNTWLPLIVPSFLGGGAFNIFLVRQFFRSVPNSILESARMDGCNEYRIWLTIMIPLSAPVMATVAIMAFLFNWNDFMGPLIYIINPNLMTLQLALRNFRRESGTQWGLLMTGSILSILPVLLLFAFFQKYFIQGIKTSGMKM